MLLNSTVVPKSLKSRSNIHDNVNISNSQSQKKKLPMSVVRKKENLFSMKYHGNLTKRKVQSDK